MKYERITIEISGVCNAKCLWCYTGRKNRYSDHSDKKTSCFMSTKDFEAGLDKLIKDGILSENADVELYNWGEPLLNPEFDGILEVLERHDMPFHISTNCSQLSHFTGAHLKNLTLFMVSLSGFSQTTYGKIHGFDFDMILKNIDKAAHILKNNGLLHVMEINFHVYKFNIHEIPAAKKYFESRGIRFVPRLAYFNDYYLFEDYLNSRMNKRLKSMADRHLMVETLVQETKFSPKDYSCPQHRKLVVDENWQLIPCCRLSSDERLGNILEMSKDEIDSVKTSLSYCKPCIASGQSYTVHQELKFDFGVIGRAAAVSLVPKLLVDYSGKGFYWFCTLSGGAIDRNGKYDHTFSFSASPKALRLLVPFGYNNMLVSDVNAVSDKGECQVVPIVESSPQYKDLYQGKQAAFDIVVDKEDINQVNISFDVSFISENFSKILNEN